LSKKITYIFCLISFFGISQNIKVEYASTFISFEAKSTIDLPSNQKAALMKAEKMMKTSVEDQQIVLYTKPNNQFLLEVKDKMSVDNQFQSFLGVSLLNLHSYIFGKNDSIVLGYSKNQNFIVEYENINVTWKVTNESKDILGFKCFKAIPQYNEIHDNKTETFPTEVWFTPSINKRGGPFVYSNLPGLILEVVKSKSFTIKAIKIEWIKEDREVPEIDKKIITELQAYKIAKATGAAIESRIKK
jgi:GLPGLI family protein